MRCKTCGVKLSNNWKELVIDIDHPKCGFCDGTIQKIFENKQK